MENTSQPSLQDLKHKLAIAEVVLSSREGEIRGLRTLCAQAADALGPGQYTATEVSDLIDKLRKAAG